MSQYDEIKERVAELAAQRDRTGKPPLETKERLCLLNEIYDGLLYLWKQAVISGVAKGTSGIAHQLERARLEMVDLERTHGGGDDVVINVNFMKAPERDKDEEKAAEEER